MNKERLINGANWLEANVPQERFNIRLFREGQDKTPECDSVGCAVGHLTSIDAENVLSNYTHKDGDIMFMRWSEDYFELNSDEWDWCFSCGWHRTDNTVSGAAKRMRLLANEGLPSDWYDQMRRIEPISY